MLGTESRLNQLHSDTCIKIYDPSIKKLIAVYANAKKASIRLGIPSTTLQSRYCDKKRIYSPKLDLEIAVRLSSIQEGDSELIQKTINYKKL